LDVVYYRYVAAHTLLAQFKTAMLVCEYLGLGHPRVLT